MSTVEKLWVKGFRNLEESVINLPNRVFILGQNSQGKTNFLESIYLGLTGESFKEKDLENLINYTHQEAVVGLDYIGVTPLRIYIKVSQNGSRQLVINGKPCASSKKMKNEIKVEYCSADTLLNIQQNPEFRRHFLDRWLEKINPEFKVYSTHYAQALRQKNTLLKSNPTPEHIQIWNQKLVALSALILKARFALLIQLQPILLGLIKDFDYVLPKDLQLHYMAHGLDSVDLDTYEKKLMSLMQNDYPKEVILGYSRYGVHRDDFNLECGGKEVFNFFSRGMNKVMTFLLFLAKWTQEQSLTNSPPILLLDDCFSEMDMEAKCKCAALIKQNQVVYTSTLPSDHLVFRGASCFGVDQGKVKPS